MKLTSNQIEHANDSCYRLRALLRVLESDARDVANRLEAGPLMQSVSDIAALCEVGGELMEAIHEVIEGLDIESRTGRAAA